MDIVSHWVNELLGRSSGPMHFRLVMQPIMAAILAIRAGLRDARAGEPAFFWEWLTNPAERRRLVQSGWKDIGKVCIIALALDTIYQIIELKTFHIVQALIVAIVVAVIPYILLRGPVNRLARALSRKT